MKEKDNTLQKFNLLYQREKKERRRAYKLI